MHTYEIDSREQLAKFINKLANESCSDHWENRDITAYLNAMAAWVNDMDGAYRNNNIVMPEKPTWGMIADILKAASMY